MKKQTVIPLIFAANRELELSEYSEAGGPLDRLSYGMNMASRAQRIDAAELFYLHGSSELRGSRAFDNCFEQNDGDKVARELAKRAHENPALYRAIANDFGGIFPPKWLAQGEIV